jgi:hypothetical protein
VLLGLAAVAISFSAYQAALWGGIQDETLTDSVLTSNESVDLYQNADTKLTSDQALFIEILTSGACDEEEDLNEIDALSVCGQIFGGLSEEGQRAVEVWTKSEDEFPFRTTEYEDSLYGPGEELEELSLEFFADAKAASKNGDGYELASAFLTTVLFFAGISLVVRSTLLRLILLAGSSVILVGSTAYLLTLPKTF